LTKPIAQSMLYLYFYNQCFCICGTNQICRLCYSCI